jgi:rhamnogalacturonyl hydrolase YesR
VTRPFKGCRQLDFYLSTEPKTTDGIIYHFNIKNEVWVDAYYMAPPFICRYGDIDEAMKQIKGFRKYLYHEDKQLLSHIWDDDMGNFGRRDLWGVGNGWAVAGLTRVIDMLPEDRKEDKAYLIAYVRDLLDGMIRYQREDGLFHDVLDNPKSFVATNVAQMWPMRLPGVARGYLESVSGVCRQGREGAYAKVGRRWLVQGVAAHHTLIHWIAPAGQAFLS